MENAAENLNNETKQVEDTKPTNKELMKTAKVQKLKFIPLMFMM